MIKVTRPSTHCEMEPPFLRLRRLMSWNSPRVALKPTGGLIKQEPLPSSSSMTNVKKEKDLTATNPTPTPHFITYCSLCMYSPRDQRSLFKVSFGGDHRRDDNLRSLLKPWVLEGDLVFCSVCRVAVTKLLNRREEAEDIEIRIRAVVLLRGGEQKEWSSGLTANNGTTQTLRHLVSLNTPKVFLGPRSDSVKQEVQADPIPQQIKKERCPTPPSPPELSYSSCTLCTYTPAGDQHQHLSTVTFSDPRREIQLRFLLGICTSNSNNLTFCKVCRHAVKTLFYLREEVVDIEIRIRAVMKLRGLQMIESGGQRHIPTSVVHDDGTSTSLQGKKDKTGRDQTKNRKHKGQAIDIPKCKEGETTQYGCPKCHTKFARRGGVYRHMKRTHGWDTNISGRKFCPICKRILTMDNFKAHSHPHKGDPSKVLYTCALCQTTFKKKVQYTNHVIMSHKGAKKGDIVVNPPRISSVLTADGVSRYQCPECEKDFANKKIVYNHLSGVHGLHFARTKVCPICKKVFRSSYHFKAHSHPDKRNASIAVYTCPLCQKTFESTGRLITHKRQVHQRKTEVACPSCDKVFMTRGLLSTHAKICGVPAGQRRRECSRCGKVFTSVPERNEHERVVHIGLSSGRCYFCSKLCSGEIGLGVHMKIHTREHPYNCGQKCGMTFSFASNLRKHLLESHGHGLPILDGKFCSVCKKVFGSHYLCSAHSHPDKADPRKVIYTCPICRRVFNTKDSFSRHKSDVHLKKGHRHRCGKILGTRRDYSRHIRICELPGKKP